MRRFIAQSSFKFFRGRQSHPFFRDEPAQATTVTFAAQRAGQQGKLRVAPRFVPRAECAGGDILADAFFRKAQERKLPIVDCSRPVGGQMRDPTLRHELVYNGSEAVLHQVCAENQYHARVAGAGGFEALGASVDLISQGGGAGLESGASGAMKISGPALRLRRWASGRTFNFWRSSGAGKSFMRCRAI
jgi:hypothetical protein